MGDQSRQEPCSQRSLPGRAGTRARTRKMGRIERLEGRNREFQVGERGGSKSKRTEAGRTAHNSSGREQAGLARATEDYKWEKLVVECLECPGPKPETRNRGSEVRVHIPEPRNQSLELQAQGLIQSCPLGWCKMPPWGSKLKGHELTG